MSNYFRMALTLLYIEFTAFAFLILLSLCRLYLTTPIVLLAMSVWSLFCCSAAGLPTDLFLFFFFETRKPILEEEERLGRCLGEVLKRAGSGRGFEHGDRPFELGGDRRFELLIEEKMELNAFAIGYNKIVLSRGIMEEMDDDDLKGILAHELGHLRSKDWMIGSAFEMACWLPGTFRWLFRSVLTSKPVRLILRMAGASRLFALVLGLSLGYFLYIHDLFLPAILFCLFVIVFNILERVFRWLLLMGSCYTEYKQDAFAHELGYGRELRKALYKLTRDCSKRVNRWFILRNSPHPVIFNRIRRLEKLEGLR